MRQIIYSVKFIFLTVLVLVLLIFPSFNHGVFSSTNLSQKQLEDFTRSITVRIFSQNQVDSSSGSGVLIIRYKGKYLVVTNEHVTTNKSNSYQIQTPDGKYYSGKVINSPNSKHDVSFLTFTSSNKKYQVVNLKKNFNSRLGENVMAGGFPLQDDLTKSDRFHVTTGKINSILARPFVGGYQIGYTNLVKNGMSGGPLLDRQRNLIGINGMGKYPLFGNPYTFEDGSTISDEKWDRMSNLSWAIPVKNLLPLPNL